MRQARLIVDSALEGSLNMAVDQMLLASANASDQITLRFYHWIRPTLSLGYFQSHLDRKHHPASSSCDLVRRTTGGGAILHDRELTYSVTVPRTHPVAARHLELYRLAHQTLIQSLALCGVDRAVLYSEPASVGAPRQSPFLCFLRRSVGDVILHGQKICGSAQRRSNGAVLQHGSILVGRSQFAPELPGIEDLTPGGLETCRLVQAWGKSLETVLNVALTRKPWTASEMESARQIQRDRFTRPDWNCRR